MTTDDQKRAYLKALQDGYALIEEQRRQEVRRTDTARSIELLDDAFESEMWLRPEPRKTSGLVEQQAILARARR